MVGERGWYDDGHLSCVEWMEWRLRMGRATAFDKLRVARRLRRRPLVAAAFAEGRIRHCMARSIIRIDDPDPEVDAALIDLAVAGTVREDSSEETGEQSSREDSSARDYPLQRADAFMALVRAGLIAPDGALPSRDHQRLRHSRPSHDSAC